MMIITPEDMSRRSFLGQPRDKGERERSTIVKSISNHNKSLESNFETIKFLYYFNDDQYEKYMHIITSSDILKK